MTAFPFHAEFQATDLPMLTLACPASGNSPQPTEIAVGQIRHSDIQVELDDAIRDLQTLAALAADAGQDQTAIEYTRRLLAASASRTAEHRARLDAERLAAVEASLDAGVDFFQVEGRRAAQERSAA